MKSISFVMEQPAIAISGAAKAKVVNKVSLCRRSRDHSYARVVD